MKIERKLLQDALAATRNALATKDPSVQNACYWFTGKRLFAYNKTIGIDVELVTDFQGGVMGATLSGIVAASAAKFAELEVADKNLVLKMGGSKAKFPALPFEEKVWSFPKLAKAAPVEVGEDFAEALKRVLLPAEDAWGISFVVKGKFLNMWSTNDHAIAFDRIPRPEGMEDLRVELPRVFCEQLLSLWEDTASLYFTQDSVCAVLSGGTRLFSHLLSPSTPLDYDKLFKESVPKDYVERLQKIPDKLAPALDRVLVMTLGNVIPTNFAITGTSLALSVKSNTGSLNERMTLEGSPYEQETLLDSWLIRKGLDKCDSFFIAENVAVMGWGDQGGVFVVAALG